MSKGKLAKLALCMSLAMSVVSCQGLMIGDILVGGQTPVSTQDNIKQGQIDFKTLVQGDQSGIKTAKNYIIQSNEEFTTFWKEHTSNRTPAQEMPKVDFAKSTVIGVFIGETPSNNKKVAITQIVDSDKKVTVNAKISKIESMLTVVTYPFHLVVTSQKITKPIEFNVTGESGTPAQVQNVLKFETMEGGTNSCIKDAVNVVARTKEEWTSLYNKHIACKDIDSDTNSDSTASSAGLAVFSIPSLDFDKQMVVGVFLGNRPSSGYNVKVTQIIDQKDSIEVYATETTPDTDKMSLTVMTAPYHIIKLDKSNKTVKFFVNKGETPVVQPSALPGLPIKYEIIESGADSCINEQVNFVIDNKEKWQDIFKQHTSCKPVDSRCTGRCLPIAPDVDFENYIVLALFGGEKINGCSPKIGIKDVIENEKEVAVNIAIPAQDPNIACFRMVQSPYFFAVIPKVKKPINFYYPTTSVEPFPTVIPTITPTVVPTIMPTILPVPAEKILSVRNIGNGSMSAIHEYKEIVAYSQDEYNKLWNEHNGTVNSITDTSTSNPPPVDFDKEMVISVFLGTRTSGGYGVKIDRIVYKPALDTTIAGGGEIYVYATETAPASNSMSIMILTYPYHIIATEKILGAEVKFISQ